MTDLGEGNQILQRLIRLFPEEYAALNNMLMREVFRCSPDFRRLMEGSSYDWGLPRDRDYPGASRFKLEMLLEGLDINEFRKLKWGLPPEVSPSYHVINLDNLPAELNDVPEDSMRTLAGDIVLRNEPEAPQDPWSIGRMKRRWLKENPDLLEKQLELLRTKNEERVRDAGGRGRGPWQFTKSLCHEYGLNCPEFSPPSP